MSLNGCFFQIIGNFFFKMIRLWMGAVKMRTFVPEVCKKKKKKKSHFTQTVSADLVFVARL